MKKHAEIAPNAAPTAAAPDFSSLVDLIESARTRAFSAVNAELIKLYWNIGKFLSELSEIAVRGENVIFAAAGYLKRNRPDLRGFSVQALYRMRQFYMTYKDDAKFSPLVRKLSWANNIVILSRANSAEERRFYIEKCISEHYSKRQLERQFDTAYYERCKLGADAPAPARVAKDIRSIIPDLYALEFLGVSAARSEANLRDGIVDAMRDFVLESGRDFTFVGKEYPVRVGMEDFKIDLLFFNRALRCFFAFELKTRKFQPSDIGQINFYLEALDRDVKRPDENPSVGIVLCADKDDAVVEYALSRSLSPALVAEYKLALPDKRLLQDRLRSVSEMLSVAQLETKEALA